jgi:hypothetical protein
MLLALLVVCGCTTPPRGAPTELEDGFRRDGLARCIAGDLLLLKHTSLFSYPSKQGYNGTMVNSTTYVEEATK